MRAEPLKSEVSQSLRNLPEEIYVTNSSFYSLLNLSSRSASSHHHFLPDSIPRLSSHSLHRIPCQDSGSNADSKNKPALPIPPPPRTVPTIPGRTLPPRGLRTRPLPAPKLLPPMLRPAGVVSESTLSLSLPPLVPR